jgi:hypothetical protein
MLDRDVFALAYSFIPLKWLLPAGVWYERIYASLPPPFSPDGTAQGLWVERGII